MRTSPTLYRDIAALGCLLVGTCVSFGVLSSSWIDKGKRPWSIDDDSFREGTLWPAILLLATTLALLCIGMQVVRGNYGSSDLSAKPVHRPALGPVRLVDNRFTSGAIAIILCTVHTATVYFWSCYDMDNGKNNDFDQQYQLRFATSLFLASAAALAISFAYFGQYLCSNRLAYKGLFPWPMYVLLAVQLVLCVGEIYFSFFTPQHISEPIFGRGATKRSNFLVSAAISGTAAFVSLLMIQHKPLFVRSSSDSSDDSDIEFESAETSRYQSIYSRTPLAPPRYVQQKDLAETPELAVSWLSWLAFLWPDNIIGIGACRRLSYEDLYKLDDHDLPELAWAKFKNHLKRGRSLLKTMVFAFAFEFTLEMVLIVVFVIMQLSGPFFLRRILLAIESWNSESAGTGGMSLRTAYLSTFGMLLLSLVKAFAFSHMNWVCQRLHINLSSAFTAELTNKTLLRRAKGASSKCTSGYAVAAKSISIAADGKVMNILTVDLKRVTEAPYPLSYFVGSIVRLFFGVWYMYSLVGISMFAGLPVLLLYYYLAKVQIRKLKTMEVKQSALNDERITAISEMFQGIRAIKLFGWESQFIKRIEEYREKQLASRWAVVKVWIQTNAVAILTPNLILVAIFFVYVAVLGNQLTAAVAFTSISVLLTLRTSFERLPSQFSNMVSLYVSLMRVEDYLNQPEVQSLENRVHSDTSDSGGRQDTAGFIGANLTWDIAESTDAADRMGDNMLDEHTRLLSEQQQLGGYSGSASSATLFMLKNISIRFPAGGLSLVAGPTGSGKSSLLAALVGEMSLTSGHIILPTTRSAGKHSTLLDSLNDKRLKIANIAYVAQEAWLRSATVRENILFGEPYDQERYEETLRICSLKHDLRILIAGDLTEIGERGVILSGGQKQRVALARAVYSRSQILLIDDCLSAVDTHTAKHILAECLAGNSPLMRGRTRVLVTHHVSLCLPYAQHAVFMYKGEISMQGTPQELKASGTLSVAIADLEKSFTVTDRNDNSDSASSKPAAISSEFIYETEDSYNQRHLQKISTSNAQCSNADLSALKGMLVADEGQANTYAKLDTWKTYFLACGSRRFFGLLVLQLVIWQASVVLRDNWVRIWVDSSVKSGQGNGQHRNAYWIGIYMSIGCFSALWTAFRTMYSESGALCASRNLHMQMLQALVHASPRFFDSTPIGHVISRFSRDIQVIESECMVDIVSTISQAIAILSIFAIIGTMAPMFICIAIGLCGVFILLTYYYIRASCELKRLDSNSISPLLSLFTEVVAGVSTIRAYNIGSCYTIESLHRTSQKCRSTYLIWSIILWMNVKLEAISALLTFSCTIFSLYNVDSLDAGKAGLVLSYSLTLSHYASWVVQKYTRAELDMNSVDRISQYLTIEQEAGLHSKSGCGPPANWPASGKVDIENLVLEYIPGNPVLHGISMSVRSGEKIGVVGRTGAGKSTLSLALLRFIETTSGRIMLDGIDISKVGLEELRQNVTIIPQDPVLFNGTIRFNLDPFNEYPDNLLWNALTRVRLVKEETSHANGNNSKGSCSGSSGVRLERMQGVFGGLGDEIKENGQNLSLGQKQLVALARALVRRSRLIVMDEATASVDFNTDNHIQQTIRGPEFANSTLFCIAHRLRTIVDYDKVLVLDKGKMVEFDTPSNLLRKKNGIFKSMCESSKCFIDSQSQLP